jgi:hypothetical protein
VYWRGEVQLANAAPSSEHRNVDPASSAEKAKLAEVLVVWSGGRSVIVVSGGLHSALHTTPRHCSGLTLPVATLPLPSVFSGPALMPHPPL